MVFLWRKMIFLWSEDGFSLSEMVFLEQNGFAAAAKTILLWKTARVLHDRYAANRLHSDNFTMQLSRHFAC